MSFDGKFLVKPVQSIRYAGELVLAANAGTTGNIKVLMRDEDFKILMATGTDVPTDDTDGYAKGCIFINTDVTAGTGGTYENIGDTDDCNFDILGAVTAGSVDTAELAAGAVTLAKLDVGVTPTHVVKYAGEVTWTGGLATLAATITGVAATDIVIASILTLGTEGTILQGAIASANTITFTLDAANTSNDAVISYVVFRAVV